MKKILQCFALVMLLFYADSYDVAEAYYECSANETQCADAKLTYGGVDRVFSKKVFLTKEKKLHTHGKMIHQGFFTWRFISF